MFAPFVSVPLVMELIERRQTITDRYIEALKWLTLPLALLAAISFSFDPGLEAALLATPWMLYTAAAAVLGALRFLGRRSLLDPVIGIDIGLVLVLVGGIWMFISRLGLNPLGFSDAIVELTAVHFHYTGLCLPVVAGLILEIRSKAAGLIWLIVAGIVATAIGITVTGIVEFLGATLMAFVGLFAAYELWQARNDSLGGRIPFIGSAIALFGGMTMALIWSWTRQFGLSSPSLDFMVITHGALNAFGFSFLALIGLLLEPTRNEEPRMVRVGRPKETMLANLYNKAKSQSWESSVPLEYIDDDWHTHAEVRSDRKTVRDLSACSEAIRNWAGHTQANVTFWPPQAPIQAGQYVVLSIPAGPLSVLAVSKVMKTVDATGEFGFTYAATKYHPMKGVEYFGSVQHDKYCIINIALEARPAIVATKLGGPIATYLQRRTIGLYQDGITGKPAL